MARWRVSTFDALIVALTIVMGVIWSVAAQADALSDGRRYEMVSPPYKGGYSVLTIGTIGISVAMGGRAEGERVAFSSQGAFAGTLGVAGGAGQTYVARRFPSGWSTTPQQPPSGLAPEATSADFSPDLASELFFAKVGPNAGSAEQDGTVGELLLRRTDTPDTTPDFEVAGNQTLKTVHNRPFIVLPYAGASADLCHIALSAPGPDPFLEGDENQIYELSSTPAGGCAGNGSPVLRAVAVNNEEDPKAIDPYCTPMFGAEELSNRDSAFNAVSHDGQEFFFTSNVDPAKGGGECGWQLPGTQPPTLNPMQLFVRIDGRRTVEVSKPIAEASTCSQEINSIQVEKVPCPAAATRANVEFQGASEDGSMVFFISPLAPGQEPFVPGDTDASSNLYMAKIGCPESKPVCGVDGREITSLVQISHNAKGEAANVQGVVRMAPGGGRVYFIARGDLLESSALALLEREGRSVPHAGADNLYVYDSESDQARFITDLCSGPLASGEVEDRSCPSDLGTGSLAESRDDQPLWSGVKKGAGEAQTAGQDGRFLLFSSYGRLVSSDADNAKDVYRYDANTGALARVSVGEAGHDANGNRYDDAANGKTQANADARIPVGSLSFSVDEEDELGARAISEDGSRVVFTTAEPLSEDAVNGVQDVYEWNEGKVALISSGNSITSDCCPVIIPSGRDVFFVTSQALLPQDADEEQDVYDARIGGGFPVLPAQRRPCEGDACQGPLTNPTPLLVPGSVVQMPGEGVPVPKSAVCHHKAKARCRSKKKRVLKTCKRKHGRRLGCIRRRRVRKTSNGRGQ